MTIRLGLQIPNFTYGTGVEQLFPTVIAQAREADAAGFDSAFLMDHFYQLPGLGSPDQPMLEAYTALGALASATKNVQLGGGWFELEHDSLGYECGTFTDRFNKLGESAPSSAVRTKSPTRSRPRSSTLG